MKLLFLEPFYGGSHRDFADGLCRHSKHRINLYTLPARFWKWRMRGAAINFARRIENPAAYDAVLCSSLMSLSDFKALCRGPCPPAAVYFHENQLTYPVAPGCARDLHFGFTDITTALSAERVLFNSETHFSDFFSSLPGFIKIMPDFRPGWAAEEIRSRAAVCRPGCGFSPEGETPGPGQGEPPLIVWNHRWEFDKQPDFFFKALEKIEEKGLNFGIAVLGESYESVPEVFDKAAEKFSGRIKHWGYVRDKAVYQRILERGSVVASTAIQENFGISVVEAARFGCLPLVPAGLSYPEIMPGFAHEACLYQGLEEMVEKLSRMLADPGPYEELRRRISLAMRPYSWKQRAADFDRELELTAGRRQ